MKFLFAFFLISLASAMIISLWFLILYFKLFI